MRREERLTRQAQWAEVWRSGRSWASELLVLRACPNGGPLSRWGFSVGRRLGNAVVRNRVRRRLREAARQFSVVPGWDLAWVARLPASQADYHQLRQAMEMLLRRAGLLALHQEGGVD